MSCKWSLDNLLYVGPELSPQHHSGDVAEREVLFLPNYCRIGIYKPGTRILS
jgi:hypothetical protein